MKRIIVIILSILCNCSCSPKSKLERAEELLMKAYVDNPTGYYFEYHVDEHDDPIAFAKELIGGSYQSEIKKWYQEWYPKSGKVPIGEAFEKRWIRFGMTYEEIKEVIGSAESLSKTDGVIQYAYYRDCKVQLCFRNGKLYKWNEN